MAMAVGIGVLPIIVILAVLIPGTYLLLNGEPIPGLILIALGGCLIFGFFAWILEWGKK